MVGPLRNQVSAGLVLYRIEPSAQVLIAHPGGPYWKNKDNGAWSIPKGIVKPEESLLDAARREFQEETGLSTPESGYLSLGSIIQRSGKRVHAWAVAGDADPSELKSNTFTMEWPPRSRRFVEFPEMDRFMWANPELAGKKLNRAQTAFVSRLLADIEN